MVIAPLRRTHGPLPPTDLLERYAVSPSMSRTELASRIAEVRRYWRKAAQGPDRRALVCRKLLADDEARVAGGARLHDPEWWRQPAPFPDDAAREPLPDSMPAAHDSAPSVAAGPPTGLPVTDSANSRAGAAAPPGGTAPAPAPIGTDEPLSLSFSTLNVWNDGGRIAISWVDPPEGRVRIRRFEEQPPWDDGDSLELIRLERVGDEVHGDLRTTGGETTLEAQVPAGYYVYVPFTIESGFATVGRFCGWSIASPVRELRAQRTADTVKLSWYWPDEARMAEVEWRDAQEHNTWRVSRTDYLAGNGFAIPVPVTSGVAGVKAITVTMNGETMAPAATIDVPAVPARLSYTLSPVGGRRSGRWTVELTALTDCASLDLAVVALVGVLPAHRTHGETIARQDGLSLTEGQIHTLPVELPEGLRGQRDVRLRCFAEPASVIDPPATTLKVT
jgi:hypothetical protein